MHKSNRQIQLFNKAFEIAKVVVEFHTLAHKPTEYPCEGITRIPRLTELNFKLNRLKATPIEEGGYFDYPKQEKQG